MIPPEASDKFAAAMERVLDIYQRPGVPAFSMVCMEETQRYLIRGKRAAVPVRLGEPEPHDYE